MADTSMPPQSGPSAGAPELEQARMIMNRGLEIYQPLLHLIREDVKDGERFMLISRMIDILAGSTQLQALLKDPATPPILPLAGVLGEKLLRTPIAYGGLQK